MVSILTITSFRSISIDFIASANIISASCFANSYLCSFIVELLETKRIQQKFIGDNTSMKEERETSGRIDLKFEMTCCICWRYAFRSSVCVFVWEYGMKTCSFCEGVVIFKMWFTCPMFTNWIGLEEWTEKK